MCSDGIIGRVGDDLERPRPHQLACPGDGFASHWGLFRRADRIRRVQHEPNALRSMLLLEVPGQDDRVFLQHTARPETVEEAGCLFPSVPEQILTLELQSGTRRNHGPIVGHARRHLQVAAQPSGRDQFSRPELPSLCRSGDHSGGDIFESTPTQPFVDA